MSAHLLGEGVGLPGGKLMLVEGVSTHAGDQGNVLHQEANTELPSAYNNNNNNNKSNNNSNNNSNIYSNNNRNNNSNNNKAIVVMIMLNQVLLNPLQLSYSDNNYLTRTTAIYICTS